MKLHMMRGVLGGVAIAALGALGWLAGCSDNPPGPASPVASLTVTPDAVALLAPGTVQLSAVVRDANGKVLAGRPITWASDNAAVATVDGNGMVSGIGEGVATVSATSEGVSDDGAVTVHRLVFMFMSNRDGNSEIYVTNADGRVLLNLTNNAAFDYGGAWSPDGQRIAFNSSRDGNNEIYVMNADGSAPTRLTNNGGTSNGATVPIWSPDGQKIAFQFVHVEGGILLDIHIYVMNADGSAPIR